MKQTVWHHLKLCPQGDPHHTLADAASPETIAAVRDVQFRPRAQLAVNV